MYEEILKDYMSYKEKLITYTVSLLNKLKNTEFEEDTEISFIFDDGFIENIFLHGVDSEGSLIGLFDYMYPTERTEKEDIPVALFTIEQLIDLIEILEQYEIKE